MPLVQLELRVLFRFLRIGALAFLVVGGLSCSRDDILRPDTPDIIDPEALDNRQGAPAIYAGAISDLVFASTGSDRGVVVFSGLFTDEFMHAGTTPEIREWDLRAVRPTSGVTAGTVASHGTFLLLHRARTALESGARALSTLLPANDKRVGELWALAGMTYILFGENYCSGTPFSERDPTNELGSPLTTAEMLDRAVERLNTAAASSSGDATVDNLIAVLRGRALLNAGRFPEATQAVVNVPTAYVYRFLHTAPPGRQLNQIFLLNTAGSTFSVPDREGTNGLNFASAADPRLPVSPPRVSPSDGITPLVNFLRYTSVADPVPMATGIEARLIEAEAALRNGNTTEWLAKLNGARATVVGLSPLSDPGSSAQRVDLTFRERAFWLFLTGHRLGDLRRLVRQYGRPAESVYPTGAYHKLGLTRGGQLTLIVPQPEENNPNYTAADCAVTSP